MSILPLMARVHTNYERRGWNRGRLVPASSDVCICEEADAPDVFLAQYCGHVFCKDCISQVVTCPICRTEWGSRPPFKLYLEFPEASAFSRLNKRIENMNEDTPCIVAEKTCGIVRKFVEDSNLTDDTAQIAALLDAVERLEKRVIPLFSDVKRVREENLSLRQQLAASELDIQSKKGLAVQIAEMNYAIVEQNQTLHSVSDELAREKKKRSSEENANHRLVHSIRKKQEQLKIKEREIESLRSVIEERDKQLHLQKRKLRELAKRLKASPVAQNVDDSLIVESPLSDIVNDKTLPKLHSPEASSSNRSSPTTPFPIHKRQKTRT